jgi:hypothetical protein
MVNLLRNPRVQGIGDALLAAFMAVSSVMPVLTGDPSWGRPKTLGVALALLSTVPVAWRARRPLTMAAIVLGANVACIYAAAPHQAAFGPMVVILLIWASRAWQTWGMPVRPGCSVARIAVSAARSGSAKPAGPVPGWRPSE